MSLDLIAEAVRAARHDDEFEFKRIMLSMWEVERAELVELSARLADWSAHPVRYSRR